MAMNRPDKTTFTDTPRPSTTVTVKIEDTAKGARLEVKVEHAFQDDGTDQGATEELDFLKSLVTGVYERLEPIRMERPIV